MLDPFRRATGLHRQESANAGYTHFLAAYATQHTSVGTNRPTITLNSNRRTRRTSDIRTLRYP